MTSKNQRLLWFRNVSLKTAKRCHKKLKLNQIECLLITNHPLYLSFRINFISVKPLCILCRLTARDFDINASVDLFCNHLEFRQKYKLDDGFMQNYKCPEVLNKYYPGGVCGTCKEGYVVKYEMPGKLDVKVSSLSSSSFRF